MSSKNKSLQRVRRITDFGKYKEVENQILAPMLGNHDARESKLKKTAIAIAKNNDRHTVVKVENKIKANFSPRDWYLTLSYADERLPHDEERAKKNIRNFLNKVKRRYIKAGKELKYLVTTEQGERSGRWHHHLIIPAGITYDDIERLWQDGSVFPRRLWAHGNMNDDKDRLNVHRLAEYFVGTNKKGKSRDTRAVHKKRYSFSRNCIEPVVTYEAMPLRWVKKPRPPKGWKIAAGSLVEYEDAYGFLHQKYTLVKNE